VQKKTAESINSKLQLVMKSGKALLGYKQVLKTLRNGDGACRWPARLACLLGRPGISMPIPVLVLCTRIIGYCAILGAVAEKVWCLDTVCGLVRDRGISRPSSQADHHCLQLPSPAEVRDRVLRYAFQD
jgi:hypothetical protein